VPLFDENQPPATLFPPVQSHARGVIKRDYRMTDTPSLGPAPSLKPEAIEIWRQRIHAETFGHYSVVMGVRLLCLKETSAAIEHFRQAAVHLGAGPEVQYLLTQALIQADSSGEAIHPARDAALGQPDVEREGFIAVLDRLAQAQAFEDAATLILNAPATLRRQNGVRARLVEYLIKSSRFVEAHEAFLEAERDGTEPEDLAAVHTLLGVSLIKAGAMRLREAGGVAAIDLLRRADALLGGRADARYMLIRALTDAGREAEAEQIRRVSAGMPSSSDRDGFEAAVTLLINEWCHEGAETLIRKALSEPNRGDARYWEARLCFVQGRYEASATALAHAGREGLRTEAVAGLYEELVRRICGGTLIVGTRETLWPLPRVCDLARGWAQAVPDAVDAHLVSARSHLLTDRIEEALAAYERAAAIDPSANPPPHLYVGMTRLALGRPDDAVAAFEAQMARPGQADLNLTWLGLARHAQGRLEDAAALHQRAIEAVPGDGHGWSNLGLIHLARGDLAAARDAQTKALSAANPAKGWSLSNLAVVELRLGDPEKADELFRQAYASQPLFAPFFARMRAWLAPEILPAYRRLGLLPSP
jgi:tetratricopeptide (TPR) repeat protein